MKKTRKWSYYIASFALIGVISVYAQCNTDGSAECKAMNSACSVASPN